MENISCTVWFAFLLDEGTDIVPLQISWPLPSGRWAEPGRPDLLSVLPRTTGLSCWLESNKPHSDPKGTQTTIWVFGLQTHGCYIHAKSPPVWILGAVVHKCCQAHSEKHIKDFAFARVIGEDLIRYEMLKVCSTAPIFNIDFMDTETGTGTGSSSCWSSPHSRPYCQATKGLSPLTENITSSQGSNQGGHYINNDNINLNVSN